ncbi:hypothetical protein GCM10029976_085860 [Kribbella albertanoniae]|uniref:Uncharacterized protein n=1 Tax=Kribbella albertanoniae TaxID=1266829 RepID=A0A4R4Q1J9_9ACTN|nr:hypothetical protein [Kribbella albertanoniae]TDC28672.1 hypothetical protein E1261_17840 [Kribbella albertanoniae]
MTEHPGEQFPPDVDPDVEPDYAPEHEEERTAQPDYDSEPGSQSLEDSAEPARVDPAEIEFGPEFAREPAEQHEQPFEAESPADDSAADDSGHPLVDEVMGRLHDLRDKPVAEHAEVYADLHERLQTALVEADADQGDRSP